MSMRLALQLLGSPQLHLGDKLVVTDRRKAVALIAYLAVNSIGQPSQRYSREFLSTLLWSDYGQSKAFTNLRRTIWEIHQALGEGWLLAERESVQLNPGGEMDLDVACFRDLLSRSHQQTEPALRLPILLEAVNLYRNHFLTGFTLRDAPNFNDWSFAEAEDLRHRLT